MANLKISQLTAYTTPINIDLFPVVDITTSETKKITFANLAAALGVSANAVTAASTFATDNVLLRSDGTGRGAQSSGITIGDNNNISYTIADAANVDALTITQSDVTNNKKGIVLAGATSKALLQLTPTGSLGTSAGTSGSFLMDYTNATGIAFQLYTNSTGASLTYPQLLIHSANAAYNQPLLQITHNTGAGLGNSPNIRLDGAGAGPQIEWRQTSDPSYGVTGAGQFEQQVQGDIFFLNGRNYANTSFDNVMWVLRPSTTDSMNGNVGIGANPYGIEKLTIGSTTGGTNTRIALYETTAPTLTANYGKFYVKASDHLAYFMDSSGTEYNITTSGAGDFVGPASSVDNALVRFDGTSGKLGQTSVVVITDAGAATGFTTINGYYPAYSGSDAVVNATDALYTTIALALAGSPGKSIYISDGTWTQTAALALGTSSTKLNLSGGATVQNNGATVTTLIAVSSTTLSRLEITGGKFLQTNATAQGVCLDLSDTANAWVSRIRIEEYGTGIKMWDNGVGAASTTFYNSVRDIQMFNVNNGIDLGGTQPNLNLWENVRIRQKAGGAGTGVNMVDTRGNVFIMVDAEPSVSAGITGFHLDATTRDNLFMGCWIENNAVGLLIDAGATNNVFIGGSITSNTTDITDNGTGTIMIGVNKTGTKVTRFTKLTDIQGLEVLKFTETASAVNEFTLANAATGNGPTLSVTGDDSNIAWQAQVKGTGTYNFLGTSSQAATIRLYEDTDDGTNYTSFKIGTQGANIDYTLPTALPTTNNGQVMSSTTAGVMSWVSKRFVVTFQSISSTPLASTTYYFGATVDSTFSGNTTAAIRQKIIPFACTLVGAGITLLGTANSTDTFTIYARINNTTDVVLTATAAVTGTAQYFSTNALAQAIAAGDKIEIKVVTPAWVTPPTAVRIIVDLHFE